MVLTAVKAIGVGVAAGVALGVALHTSGPTSTIKEVEAVDLLSSNKASPIEAKTNKILQINNGQDNTIVLRGEVTYDSANQIVKEIHQKEKAGKDLYLLIDSPGGSVVDGAMVLSAIESSKSHVNTVCLRLCASMGFMIHQHGYRRQAVNRSILMAHHASGGARGEIPNAINLLSTVQRYVDKMDAYISKRSGRSLETFEAMISNDLWIDAEDAKQQGFLDDLVSVNDEAPVSAELFGSDKRGNKPNIFTSPNTISTTILDFKLLTK